MPKKMLSVEIESSGYDVMQAVNKVVAAQLANGAGLQEALAELGVVAAAVVALPADLKESPAEVAKGVVLASMDLVALLAAPKAPAA